MKRLFALCAVLLIPCSGVLFAQPVINDSTSVDAMSDLLAMSLRAGDYECAYSIVLELDTRDTLPSETLYNCADCLIYSEKYSDCLVFCDKWQNRYPENEYEKLFRPLKGECYYYLSDYSGAEDCLSRYREDLEADGEQMSAYYNYIYATVLTNLCRYGDADMAYNAYFSEILGREGLQLNDAYMSEQKEKLGRKLYRYAYNCFFMGKEEAGMEILYLAYRCGDEWAQSDYSHLRNCETVMMDLGLLSKKQKRQFTSIVRKYDFHYAHASDSTIDVAEDFWCKLLQVNGPFLDLQTEMNKTKKRKMLQKALDELSVERYGMMLHLKNNCTPFEPGELENSLVNRLTGDCRMAADDFRIYPANERNAFATPYGQIYLTSGLVSQYHFNENLLLGVCAHEMAHSKCSHSLVGLWKQYEKERNNRILAGVTAALYATAMAASSIYSASNGVSYNQSYYNDMAVSTTNLYKVISGSSFYYQFKYSRWQEIEADLIAYRFCEATGLGGYSYIMALQLLRENDLYLKSEKTDDHPSLAYRIALLKWLHSTESNR